MENIQNNQPFNNDQQISQQKNNVPKSDNILTGYVANSFNAGINKAITWKKIMAGEKHREYRLKANFQLLTPKTPVYQNVKVTARTYFVPNSRVWKNAEAYTAQKGGSTENKIDMIPNMGGKLLPRLNGTSTGTIGAPEGDFVTNICNTMIWRDSYISSYIPRQGRAYGRLTTASQYSLQLPNASILPLRGRIAIYNDFERDKRFDRKMVEYNTDEVSNDEWNSYLPASTEGKPLSEYLMRARKTMSYYTDYRTELQGFETEQPINEEADFTNEKLESINKNKSLVEWASWEAKIAEARTQAENQEKNDWDIIAELRGTRRAVQGKVQLIGEKTFNLNYSAVTQSAYNTNENIEEQFQVMGKQGAFSYTEIDIPLYAGMEFIEEGYIHVILTASVDNVIEKAWDRNLLNVTPLSEYRPDLIGEKEDVIYRAEVDTNCIGETENNASYLYEAEGFKRKFSEYFKLPNVIGGDMTNDNYFQMKILENGYHQISPYNDITGNLIESNSSFQFFYTSDRAMQLNDGQILKMYKWKDYSDIHMNENQAIPNQYYSGYNKDGGLFTGYSEETYVAGQNQIFFVGVTMLRAELPIDEAIKNNYTKWGEH